MLEGDEELYKIKAVEEFRRERPYGIRIDYQEKSYALFNRFFNELGCENSFDVTKLRMEKCSYIEDLSVEKEEQFFENNHIVQVYYNNSSDPYKNGVLNMKNLQVYNRKIRDLSNFIDRIL
ncbi:hypothetical protein [Bacteroides cellulosilyticus]|uniref:hypothetical protein n=1 Tax=Bacteroides cellulosilyticus TaxID=246787 RepID=UPI0022E277C3|nr:hypothetical protein [Bacteroides cellulosilyticus]